MGQQHGKLENSPLVGLRVVRGPSWKFDDQDGGEGHVGTIVGVRRSSSGSEYAIVHWDQFVEADYRCSDDAYDLRVFDNAPSGVRHEHVQCDDCNAADIAGTRWTCLVCRNYDLCTRCYMTDRHDTSHPFTRRSAPGGGAVELLPRQSSTKIEAKGMMTGATVVRGRDWEWDEQDGGRGCKGTVVGLTSFGSRGSRDAVCVRWDKDAPNERLYRLGYGGKVDLKCTTEAVDGKEYYYRDHLALVGEEQTMPFKVGDVVKLKKGDLPSKDRDGSDVTSKDLGSSADDDIQLSKRNTGVVRGIPFSNKIEVEFYGRKERRSHQPSDLEKVATFKVGTTVKITDDEREMKDCHNMPTSAASKMLGKEGIVSEVYEDGDLGIKAGDDFFIVNPLLCKAVDSCATDKVAESDVDPSKTKFKKKDIVTIIRDEDMAKSLQKGHGGWNEDMKESLGQTGEVVTVHSSGNIRVKVNKRKWTYNPKCLMPASSEAIDEYLQRSSSSSGSSSSSSDGGSAPSDGGSGMRGRVRVRVKVRAEQQTKLMFSDSMEGLSFSMPTGETKPAAFNMGDFVTISNDVNKLMTKKMSDTGKEADYSEIAGVTARVRKITYDDGMRPTEIQVIANNKLWTLTPECIQMCYNISSVYSRYEKDRLPRTHQFDSDATLVRAVQSQLRSLEDVTKVLTKHQTKLNTKVRGLAPLHIAAIVGRSDIVEQLLDRKADVNLKDERQKCTALHHAAFLGHTSTVRMLVKHEADVDALSGENWTALHYAAAGLWDSDEIVGELLGAKKDLLDLCDKYKRTPLHVAIKRHNFAVVDKLIESGANLTVKNQEGLNALHVAVLSQSSHAVKKILSKLTRSDDAAADVNALTSRGMTALHLAAGLGYETLVELLLIEGKADANYRETQTPHKDTPLLLAVRRGYDAVARLLEKHGADLEAKDSQERSHDIIAADRLKFYGRGASGANGLHRQTCSKKLESDRDQAKTDFFIKDMVRLDSDVAALRELQREYGGWSPLMENIAGKLGEVTWKFVTNGERPGCLRVHIDGMNWSINPACCNKIDVSTKDDSETKPAASDESRIGSSGGSSSSSSSSSNRVKSPDIRLSDASDEENLARLVVKSNTSQLKTRLEKLSPEKINKRTGDVCALHVAAGRGKSEAIKLLVDAKADVDVNDVDDDTPLHHAVVRGEADAAKLLIDLGADVNRRNKRMHTPMHYACGASSQNLKCLMVLLSQEPCDVNAQDQDGDTPLHCAIGKGHKLIIEELVKDSRINVDTRNRLGFNALHQAAFRGDEFTVKCLLSKHQDLVNVSNDRGQTALHLAVIHGRTDVAGILLNEGKAEVDIHTPKELRTPLLCAVAHGRLDVVKLLLSREASLSARDKNGNSCLHLELTRHRLLYGPVRASGGSRSADTDNVDSVHRKKKLEMWRLLIEKGADVRMENNDRQVAEEIAREMGFPLSFDKSETTQQASTGNKEPVVRAESVPERCPDVTSGPDATTVGTGEKSSDSISTLGSEVQQQTVQPSPKDASASAGSPVVDADQVLDLKIGDWVQIVEDKQKVKRIQRSHGGWYDGMADALGKWGKVVEVGCSTDGDIRVLVNNRKWRFGRQCIITGTAASAGDAGPCPTFKRGTVVKICIDKDKVKSLQKHRWTDSMTKVLGAVGRVTSVYDDGDVRVRAAGQHLRFNSLCLSKADEKEASTAKQQWPFFEIGDVVKVIDDIAKAKELQKGHGGWCEPMKDALGHVGTVVDIDDDDDVRVNVCGRRWVFNPECLAAGTADDKELLKAELGDASFKPGDHVKIRDNEEEVRRLQRGHGGWVRDMSKAVGKVGKVIEIDSDNDVKIRVGGRTWSMNPQCLSRVAPDAARDASDKLKADGSEQLESSSSSSSSSTSRSSEDGFRAFLKSLRKRLDKEGKDDEAKKGSTSGVADCSDPVIFSTGDFVTVVPSPCSESERPAEEVESGKLVGKTAKVCRVLDDGHLEVRFAGDASGELFKLQPDCCRRATEAEKRQVASQLDGSTGGESPKVLTTANDSSSSDSSSDGFLSGMKRAEGSSDRGREALMSAVTQGDLSSVKKALLKAKEQVNDMASGMAPLHVAAGKGAVQIMLLLLDADADVTLKDKDGDTPLHHAALGGEHEAAELLLERGAPPDAVNERLLTPLHLAVLSKNGGEEGSRKPTNPLPKLLLEKCDVNAKDEDGNTALHLAVSKESSDVVDQLLQQVKIDLTVKNDLGLSALHLAVRQLNEGVLKLIIRRVSERERKDKARAVIDSTNRSGRTALHMAAQLNFLAGAKLLIDKEQATVDVKDESGQTPLCLAVANGHLDLVKCLFEQRVTRFAYDVQRKECSVKEADHEADLSSLREVMDAFSKGRLDVVKPLVDAILRAGEKSVKDTKTEEPYTVKTVDDENFRRLDFYFSTERLNLGKHLVGSTSCVRQEILEVAEKTQRLYGVTGRTKDLMEYVKQLADIMDYFTGLYRQFVIFNGKAFDSQGSVAGDHVQPMLVTTADAGST